MNEATLESNFNEGLNPTALLVAPEPGYVLKSVYIRNNEGYTNLLTQQSITEETDQAWRVYAHGESDSAVSHTAVGLFDAPDPEFVPVTRFTLVTLGHLPSCNCPCAPKPAQVGEFIAAYLRSDHPAGTYIDLLIESAVRRRDAYGWTYGLASDIENLRLEKGDILCFDCSCR